MTAERVRRRTIRVGDEAPSAAPPDPLDLRRGLELHFFAHLNFADEVNAELEKLQFGRIHHRILYIVSQKPELTVGELVKFLRVTNQGIQRAMGDLLRAGYIEQRASVRDRRQRLLFATESGHVLERLLSRPQLERVARAYDECGPEAVQGYWCVLEAMVDARERAYAKREEGPS